MELRRLTDRVYTSPPDFVRDRPAMGAVLGDRSTLIVEAGASPAHAAEFQAELERLGRAPARVVAGAHWHWDHVFGIAA